MNDAPQTTDSLLMIRPARFRFNEQTALSNAFQKQLENLSEAEIRQRAIKEFDDLVKLLRANDINVFVVDDTPEPMKPDAIFPNNWISFHRDGTVFLYPMLSSNRMAERRADIIETLKEHFQIRRVVDLSNRENQILEGTGSMVFDHPNKIIYAALSPRTNKDLLEKFASMLAYKPIAFVSLDEKGGEIYHTNVAMCVGEKFAIICLDTIKNTREKESVAKSLRKTKHEIIEISMEQMSQFAGNMLEVRNRFGKSFLLMSKAARRCLSELQTNQIQKYTKILSANIETIEAVGGGSVRCMMAEIFCEKESGI